MRRFVLGWKRLGYEGKFGANIINYADDLVICCQGQANEVLVEMRRTPPNPGQVRFRPCPPSLAVPWQWAGPGGAALPPIK
jgi:hypothetical protein